MTRTTSEDRVEACFRGTSRGQRLRWWLALVWLVASSGILLTVVQWAGATGGSVPAVPNVASSLGPMPVVTMPPFPPPRIDIPWVKLDPLPPPQISIPWVTLPHDFCQVEIGPTNRVTPSQIGSSITPRSGAVVQQAIDLSLSGPLPGWTGARTYSSRVSGSGTLGNRWLPEFTDTRLVPEGASDVALIVDATSKRVFQLNLGVYTSPGDSTLTLEHDAGQAQFVLTDWRTGDVKIFHNFVSSYPGKLKQTTTLEWLASEQDGSVYSYNGSQQLAQVISPDGQDYNFVFSYTNNRVTKIEVRTGAESSTRVQQVEYTYFDSQTHSANVGTDGDLVQVKTSTLKTGGNVDTPGDWIVQYEQYRYGSNGQLKSVFGPDEIARLVADRADIDDADDILAKGDDDDNSGGEEYAIKDYARQQFTYYTTDVKTDNSGAGTEQDPKCVTVWAPSGENLQSKYGGTDADEVDSGTGKYLVKTETVGGCASCGGGGGSVTHEYFYMQLDHGTADSNEVVWLVVEDTKDANGDGVRRNVYGLNDAGGKLREVTISDPCGTPAFWCQSHKLVVDTGVKLNCIEEYRTPAAHNVTSSTVDEFLNPSHNGDFTNDTNTLQASSGLIQVYEYNTSGDLTSELVKRGRTGTAYYVSARDYLGGTNPNQKHLVTYRYVYPQAQTSRTAASRIQTQYSYTFWGDSDTIKTRITTLPTVASGENGSDSSTTLEEYYDNRGRLRWQKDAAGAVSYYSYHPEHGHLAYSVRDADPSSLPASAENNETKWVDPDDGVPSSNQPSRGSLPTAVEQVARYEFDSQGRLVLTATEDGTEGTLLARHYTIYEAHRLLQFPYWDTSTNRPLLPIEATVYDDGGQVTDQYSVDPARTAQSGGVPTGLSDGTNQSHYLRWTRQQYDAVSGDLTATHVYHDIPSSTYGAKDTNYTETLLGYDAQGRRDRQVAPGGTITRSVFDNLGRLSSQWVGTDDVPSSGSWSPANNAGANMTKVVQYEYDGGASGGNSNQSKVIRYLTDDVEANARVTKFKYDWRDRQVFVIDAEEFSSKVTYARVELDNIDRCPGPANLS